MPVEAGNIVTFHYTGKFEDGSVFDSSEGRDPLRSVVGAGGLIAGFEEALMGMEVGEDKSVVIPPEKGYGPHDPNLVQRVPKTAIGLDSLEVGDVLQLREPDGQNVHRAYITEIDEESIVIDLNMPLAGKTLLFDLQIVAIEAGDAE